MAEHYWMLVGLQQDDRHVQRQDQVSGLLNLNLGSTGIGAEGAGALAGSEALASLKRLSLTGNALGDEGAVALAESGTLRLDHLYLARTGVGLETAEALAKHGRTLKVLTLGGNDALGMKGPRRSRGWSGWS